MFDCRIPDHNDVDLGSLGTKTIFSWGISLKHDALFFGTNYGQMIVISLKDGSLLNDIKINNYALSFITVFDDFDLLVTNDGGNIRGQPDICRKNVWKMSDLV